MIKPINNYILIDPVVREQFISSGQDKYNEIGVVLAFSDEVRGIEIGDKVYFDSYMARKYPNSSDKNKYIYLIHCEEVCAIEK